MPTTQSRRNWIIIVTLIAGAIYWIRTPVEEKIYREPETRLDRRVRVVWVQDHGDSTDVFALGNQLKLMGLDTGDGRGERILVEGPGNFAKPLITPDGNEVIFSDRHDGTIQRVRWNGENHAVITSGFSLEVWRDPQSGVVWVYAGREPADKDGQSFKTLVRFPLHDPNRVETVWTGGRVGVDNFQLSASGRFAGGNFPWPHCGLLHLDELRFERIGRGCWTSLSPGHPDLFWIFEGNHRTLRLSGLTTGERWEVNLDALPGIDGNEVYHPRWSNHPRYMVATGPYRIRRGGNNIRGGGDAIEVFLGKFSEDYRSFNIWAALTRNQRADFFPDLWVEGD